MHRNTIGGDRCYFLVYVFDICETGCWADSSVDLNDLWNCVHYDCSSRYGEKEGDAEGVVSEKTVTYLLTHVYNNLALHFRMCILE